MTIKAQYVQHIDMTKHEIKRRCCKHKKIKSFTGRILRSNLRVDLRNEINCRMPQSERNRRVIFRWEEIMQAVPRMTNLFKEFLLKVMSLQFKRLNLTVSDGSIVW